MRNLGSEALSKEAAVRHLWRTDLSHGQLFPNLYCLLDAAQDERIFQALRQFAAKEEIACLYQGGTANELAKVAPYLVCLGSHTRIFDWLWEEGWGRSWGVFFWSTAVFDTARAHFRRLTKVTTEDGRTLLFRFYDPRVLSLFLPTCEPSQVREFFGPVSRFSIESPDGRGIEDFTHIDGLLARG